MYFLGLGVHHAHLRVVIHFKWEQLMTENISSLAHGADSVSLSATIQLSCLRRVLTPKIAPKWVAADVTQTKCSTVLSQYVWGLLLLQSACKNGYSANRELLSGTSQ